MSGLLAVKLRRDLRATWPRMVLMVVAIAVSLTAFGGGALRLGRQRQGDQQRVPEHRAGLGDHPARPAHRRRADGRHRRRRRGTRPGVIEATGRTQFTSEIEVNGQPREIPLQVFAAAPDDPMRMATLRDPAGQLATVAAARSSSDATRWRCWTWRSATP